VSRPALQRPAEQVTRSNAPNPGIRRLLLQRTSSHLVFLVQADRIHVVAVRSASRGRGPALWATPARAPPAGSARGDRSSNVESRTAVPDR
jgi:hypothetical protein